MKTYQHHLSSSVTRTIATAAWCTLVGAAAMFSLPTCAAGTASRTAAEFQVDHTPVKRDARLPLSFAPMVDDVAPSVASIFTTRKVMNPRSFDTLPFLDDPIFRRWFGGEPDAPSRPRQSPQYRKERGLGSGVIVTPDGYILTNHHVVDEADDIQVAVIGQKKQYTARVVGRDSQTDLALLKIDVKDLPALKLADSDQLEVGDVVLAIGNPFGVGQSVTHGIISALGRGGLGIEAYEDFIQTDAAINPGNSGGALVDVMGRLVGINTAIASRTGSSAGVGFAVPVNMARTIMEKLLSDGRVVRGFLGVTIQDVSPELAREFDAPNTEGALVGSVEPDSAAAEAGLKSGDIIVEFDGEPVVDSRQLRLRVAQTAPGTRTEVKVLRRGRSTRFTVTLKELPEQLTSVLGESTGEPDAEVLRDVTVSDLTADARKTFDIPEFVEGALVNDVSPDSAAYEAGLRPGDVIQEINRKPVHTARDAIEATRDVPDRRLLLLVWSRVGSHYLIVDESDQG